MPRPTSVAQRNVQAETVVPTRGKARHLGAFCCLRWSQGAGHRMQRKDIGRLRDKEIEAWSWLPQLDLSCKPRRLRDSTVSCVMQWAVKNAGVVRRYGSTQTHRLATAENVILDLAGHNMNAA